RCEAKRAVKGSGSGRQPSLGLRCASSQEDELVRTDVKPWPDLTARPRDADVRTGRLTQAEVIPSELPAGRPNGSPQPAPTDEIARFLLVVFVLIGDVAFRDEEIDEAIVVDVLELVMPGRRRSGVPAGEWLRRVDATLESDVAVRRMRWTGHKCLQAVITSAR